MNIFGLKHWMTVILLAPLSLMAVEIHVAPMGSDSNSVILISKDGKKEENNDKPKEEIAKWLVEKTVS